jgi:hypothetical protein
MFLLLDFVFELLQFKLQHFEHLQLQLEHAVTGRQVSVRARIGLDVRTKPEPHSKLCWSEAMNKSKVRFHLYRVHEFTPAV